MEPHFNKYRAWFRAVAIIVIVAFLWNDISFALQPEGTKNSSQTLAATSRFRPIVNITEQNDKFLIGDDEIRKEDLPGEFREDVGFLYLSAVVGQVLGKYGKVLGRDGLIDIFRRELAHIDFTHVKWEELTKEEDGTFCIPYVKKDGTTHELKYSLPKTREAGESIPGVINLPFGMGKTRIVCDTRIPGMDERRDPSGRLLPVPVKRSQQTGTEYKITLPIAKLNAPNPTPQAIEEVEGKRLREAIGEGEDTATRIFQIWSLLLRGDLTAAKARAKLLEGSLPEGSVELVMGMGVKPRNAWETEEDLERLWPVEGRLQAATISRQIFQDERSIENEGEIVNEVVRNLWMHAKFGVLISYPVEKDGKKGMRVVALDQGRGIGDIERAMQRGYTTSGPLFSDDASHGGLGSGLDNINKTADRLSLGTISGKGTWLVADYFGETPPMPSSESGFIFDAEEEVQHRLWENRWSSASRQSAFANAEYPTDVGSFVLDALGEAPGEKKRIIDLGAGNLYLSRTIRDTLNPENITAVDYAIEPEGIPNSQGITCVRELVEETGLDNESFDLAVMSFTLTYVQNKDKAVREISRLLRPGGRAVMVLHHPQSGIIENRRERVEFEQKELMDFLGYLRLVFVDLNISNVDAKAELDNLFETAPISGLYSQ